MMKKLLCIGTRVRSAFRRESIYLILNFIYYFGMRQLCACVCACVFEIESANINMRWPRTVEWFAVSHQYLIEMNNFETMNKLEEPLLNLWASINVWVPLVDDGDCCCAYNFYLTVAAVSMELNIKQKHDNCAFVVGINGCIDRPMTIDLQCLAIKTFQVNMNA